MKFTCSRVALASAFQMAQGAMPSRTTKPILTNAKLQVAGNSLTLFGTDLEVGIRSRLADIEVARPGEILLPAARVTTMLRELQGETVTIEARAEAIVLKGERAEYRLGIENPEEYPDIADFNEKSYYNVTAGLLKRMIRRTVFATDVESTRYALGGVHVSLKGDTINMAATDTKRLAVLQGLCTPVGSPAAEGAMAVIPVKAMNLIERTLTNEEENVSIAIRSNDALVRTSAVTIYTRLVEGRFPRYQDVIPGEWSSEVEILAGQFHAAVRQSQIVTNEESRGVEFEFGNEVLTLRSSSAELGESKIEVPVSLQGNPVSITLDARYVSDFLKVIDSEQPVTVRLINDESPLVLRTVDNYVYVVMPLERNRPAAKPKS